MMKQVNSNSVKDVIWLGRANIFEPDVGNFLDASK